MVQVRYTRNLFLRGICVIYLFAFLSFYIQIPGKYKCKCKKLKMFNFYIYKIVFISIIMLLF